MRTVGFWESFVLLLITTFNVSLIVFGFRFFEVSLTVLSFLGSVVLFYWLMIVAYRIFLAFFPLKYGVVEPGSWNDKKYNIYLLFFLIFFYPLLLTHLLPTPLYRVYLAALGAKLGKGTFPAGTVFDPSMVELGNSVVVGFNSLIIPHMIVGQEVAHQKVIIHDRVTIGVNAVVYGGTVIEQGATVLPNSMVKPNTHINADEIWGGNPAKLIKKKPS